MKIVSLISIIILAVVVVACATAGDVAAAVGFASTMVWVVIFLIYYKGCEKK